MDRQKRRYLTCVLSSTLVSSVHTKVFAEAWLFEATKGWGNIGLVVRVDEHSASLDPVCHRHRLVDVLREDAWGQAILRVVGSGDHAINIPVNGTW